MSKKVAHIISIIFHPFLIPSLGFFLLMKSTGYMAFIPPKYKQLILLITFFTTCVLPILTLAVMSIWSKFSMSMTTARERLFPLLLTACFYYLGYTMLGRIPVSGIFRIYLLAAMMVILLTLMISTFWKISLHMAGIGGLLGAILALAFRFALNPIAVIIGMIVACGLVGFSRIYLEKHNPAQVYTGFGLGVSVMYLIVYFI
ncbi:phosphatase PAP2 family protein [Prolixibacteraceae bacterium JC049]|jgi:membrane-associated phospholipid phosphatase|nr:phosphatase PAP2 family protein [Prolixibacteraceae bacterium JC049]